MKNAVFVFFSYIYAFFEKIEKLRKKLKNKLREFT